MKEAADYIVFPTRVGVDRTPRLPRYTDCNVFPTRVGVDRVYTLSSRHRVRFPHTRGGGPVYDNHLTEEEFVFPTRVGVDRNVPPLC